MSDQPGRISQSASGTSGVTQQTGAIGNKNHQTATAQLADSLAEKELTRAEVVALLKQIEELLTVATLPDTIKDDAMAYLNAAKKATDKEEPKKETVAINLREMAGTLEAANKTVEASKGIWKNVQPILVQVAKWLGTAAGALWTYLP